MEKRLSPCRPVVFTLVRVVPLLHFNLNTAMWIEFAVAHANGHICTKGCFVLCLLWSAVMMFSPMILTPERVSPARLVGEIRHGRPSI